MKKLLRKIKNQILFGCRYDSESHIKRLNSLGMKIGECVTIFDSPKTLIDETRPWLITIGDDV